MITYKRATTDSELNAILALQVRNLKTAVSQEEQQEQGYVTVVHTFEILKKMNDSCPHIIAMNGDQVVGYALAMLPSFQKELPILRPMFDIVEPLLKGRNYLAMGQICVDKPYRGQGVFAGMYQFYKAELSDHFDCLFTEIVTTNIRSLKAHKRIGFEDLVTQSTDDTSWVIVNWNWNQ